MNGARWQLRAYTKLKKEVNRDEASNYPNGLHAQRTRSRASLYTPGKCQRKATSKNTGRATCIVEEFMETDLFTVQRDDLAGTRSRTHGLAQESATCPSRTPKASLIGLITSRMMLRYFRQRQTLQRQGRLRSRGHHDRKLPLPSTPKATILDAMQNDAKAQDRLPARRRRTMS